MLPEEPERVRSWAGWSSLAFGAFLTLSCIVVALIGKGFFVDLLALVVCLLAAAVINAEGGTIGLTVIMLLYAAGGLAFLVLSLLFPENVRIGGAPADPHQLWYLWPYAGAFTGWAGINARLLWRLWDQEKAAAE